MNPGHFSRDTRAFIRLLSHYKVRFLIVGGEAVIYHGLARGTGDVDFFFEPSKTNAGRMFQALREFWGGSIPGIDEPEDLREPHAVFQFGLPPNRIDLMNSITGVSFGEAWKTKVMDSFEAGEETVPVPYIGLDALIKNKRSVSRGKDREDLIYLESARKKKLV